MDLDIIRSYAPANSEERRTRKIQGECYGCGKRGYIQKDCPTRPYEKVQDAYAAKTAGYLTGYYRPNWPKHGSDAESEDES